MEAAAADFGNKTNTEVRLALCKVGVGEQSQERLSRAGEALVQFEKFKGRLMPIAEQAVASAVGQIIE